MKKFNLTNLFLKALDLKFNPSGSTKVRCISAKVSSN
jgi:hypothetical protein